MYTDYNFKTKKALKEAVAAGKQVRVYQPNNIFPESKDLDNSVVYLEGPHYPQSHSWYAQAELKDGVIVKVK